MSTKKQLLGMVVVLILVLASGCASTSNRLPKADSIIEGKVIGLRNGNFLLASEPAALISVTTNFPIYSIEDELTDTEALKNGQIVEIGFSGMIMESYPSQLGDIKYIKILEQTDDTAGFYGDVIEELLSVDGGLKSSDEYVIMDLSEITNLTDIEKQALVNFASSTVSLGGISGNYEEYMSNENSINGVLVVFENMEITETAIKFDLYKMHIDEAPYYFRGVTAEINNNEWQYSITSQGK